MNHSLLVFSCVMLFGIDTLAAPTDHKSRDAKPARPLTSFSASSEAIALLDQSIAAYKNLKGLSLRFESKQLTGPSKGLENKGTLDFARKDKLIQVRLAEDRRLVVSDGKWFYLSAKTEDEAEAKNKPQKWKDLILQPASSWPVETFAAPGYGSDFFAYLLKGDNPLRQKISRYPVVQTVGKRLPDTTVDGVKLQGVQIRIRAFNDYEGINDGVQVQWTAWFDPFDHLLRRVQFSLPENPEVALDRFFEVKVNPDFPADTFKIPVALPKDAASKDKS